MSTRLALMVIVLAALFAAGCGDDEDKTASVSTTTATEAATGNGEQAAEDGAPTEAGGEEEDTEQLEEEVASLSEESAKSEAKPAESSGAAGYSSATNCGAGVYAKTASTSCAFALNVASDFFSSPGYRFYSYSPVTGQTYRVRCTPTWPSLCKAGNGARILITR